ncbi:MAG: radical SAM protein [Candidatus Lernaella stagnicola]|nr:radical SAM protein [Candidatus Lernaella stagnicola]
MDLNQAATRARDALTIEAETNAGVRDLLAVAEDDAADRPTRQAALRLLGALAGEAFVGPRIVHLDVVGVCNANCIYCRDHSPYIHDREPWRTMEMPYEMAARLVSEAVELGAELLPLVGAGENLLHTRFADLIALIKSQPVEFEVYTNGLNWTDEVIDLFADAPRAKATFSLSAATPATWAAFRPEMSPDLFLRIEDSMRRLVARRGAGLRVGIVHVLNRRNVGEVLPMIRQAIDLGVDEVQYKLTEMNDAAYPLKLGAPEVESIRLEIREARRLAALAGVDIHDNIEFQLDHLDVETGLYTPGLYRHLPCFAGFEMIRVRRDGAISFCCGLKFFGSASEMSLRDHWFGEAMREARRAALAMPTGANMRLPDGGMLHDPQCDFCYNYVFNRAYAEAVQEAGVAHLLAERQ